MLAIKTSLTFFLSILRSGLSFIGLYFVARFMGPEPLGELGFGIGIVGLFSFILYMGFDNAHIKRVSEGKDLSVCIGTYALIRFVLTLLFISVLILIIYYWDIFFQTPLSNERKLLLYILILVSSVESITRIASNTFNARLEVGKFELPNLIRSLFQPLLKIFIALTALGSIYGALALASANLIGSFIALFSSFYFLRKFQISRPNYDLFKNYLNFALPAMLITILFRVTTNIDKVLVGAFVGIKDLGYYYTTTQIFTVFLFGSGAIATLLLPAMSRAHSDGDYERINTVSQKSERYISLFMTPISFITILYSEPIIIFLLGQNFVPAVILFQVAATNALLISLNRAYNNIILACDRPKLMAKINFFGRILTLSLFFLLIPSELFGFKLLGFGALGALLSKLIWNIFYTLIIRYYGNKLAGVNYINHRILKHIGTSFVLSFFYFEISFLTDNILYLILIMISFVINYSIILFLIREITNEDFALFSKILSPNEMKKYLSNEINK